MNVMALPLLHNGPLQPMHFLYHSTSFFNPCVKTLFNCSYIQVCTVSLISSPQVHMQPLTASLSVLISFCKGKRGRRLNFSYCIASTIAIAAWGHDLLWCRNTDFDRIFFATHKRFFDIIIYKTKYIHIHKTTVVKLQWQNVKNI